MTKQVWSKACSVMLAFVMAFAMLGTAPLTAFADTLSSSQSLVYTEVYGVQDGYAIMKKVIGTYEETSPYDQKAYKHAIVEEDIADSAGNVTISTRYVLNGYEEYGKRTDTSRWSDFQINENSFNEYPGFVTVTGNTYVCADQYLVEQGVYTCSGNMIIDPKTHTYVDRDDQGNWVTTCMYNGKPVFEVYGSAGNLIQRLELPVTDDSKTHVGCYSVDGYYQTNGISKTKVRLENGAYVIDTGTSAKIYKSATDEQGNGGYLVENSSSELYWCPDEGAPVHICTIQRNAEGDSASVSVYPGCIKVYDKNGTAYYRFDGTKLNFKSTNGSYYYLSNDLFVHSVRNSSTSVSNEIVDAQGNTKASLPDGSFSICTYAAALKQGAQDALILIRNSTTQQAWVYNSQGTCINAFSLEEGTSSASIGYLTSSIYYVYAYVSSGGSTTQVKHYFRSNSAESVSVADNQGVKYAGSFNGQSLYNAMLKIDNGYATSLVNSELQPVTLQGYTLGAQEARIVTTTSFTLYNKFSRVVNGTTVYYVKNSSGKYGAITADGTIVMPFEYSAYYDLGKTDTNLIMVQKNGSWYFYNIATGSIPSEQTFPDVPTNAWYAESVTQAVCMGLFSGYENGNFGPSDTLTRAQLAAVMWNHYEPADSAAYNNDQANTTGLSDVESNMWYTGAVNWAIENGAMSGYENKTFGPNDTVTREQAATIIANCAAQFAGADVEGADTTALDNMPDASSVSAYARQSIAWALNNGVISGQEKDGKRYVDPLSGLIRAEGAAVTVNAVSNKLLG